MKTKHVAIIAILVVVALGVYTGYIPIPGWTGDGLGPGPLSPALESVKLTGRIQQTNGTGVSSANVYIQFDDADGVKTTITDTTGTDGSFTTENYVAEGTSFVLMAAKSGWHSGVFSKSVPTGNWADRDTADVGVYTIYYQAIASDTSHAILDQDGADITTSYNSTTKGTSLTMTVTLSGLGDGQQAGAAPYTDIMTGYSYGGLILVLAFDSNQYVVENYDQVVPGVNEWFYIFRLTPVYNDPNVVGDGSASWSVSVDLQTDGTDALDVTLYHALRIDYINTAAFGTALEQTLNIDIIV